MPYSCNDLAGLHPAHLTGGCRYETLMRSGQTFGKSKKYVNTVRTSAALDVHQPAELRGY